MVKFEIGQRVMVTRRGKDTLGWPFDDKSPRMGRVNNVPMVIGIHGPSVRIHGPLVRIQFDDEYKCYRNPWWCHEHWLEPEGGPW